MTKKPAKAPVSTDKLQNVDKKRRFAVVGVALLLIISVCALSGVYYFQHRHKNSPANATATAQISKPANVQTVQDKTEKAKSDAAALVIVISKTPTPTNKDEEAALSKKYLELGNLYVYLAQYSDAMTAFGKVTGANPTDSADAKAGIALVAVSTSNKPLAVGEYTDAIKLLESVQPVDQKKIDTYKAALKALGN